MNPQTQKTFCGNSDKVAKDINEYLTAMELAPGNIASLKILSAHMVLGIDPFLLIVTMRHASKKDPQATARCKAHCVWARNMDVYDLEVARVLNTVGQDTWHQDSSLAPFDLDKAYFVWIGIQHQEI